MKTMQKKRKRVDNFRKHILGYTEVPIVTSEFIEMEREKYIDDVLFAKSYQQNF